MLSAKTLFDKADMTHILMLNVHIVAQDHLPNVDVLLRYFVASIHLSVPAFIEVVGLEDHISPTVEDVKLERLRIPVHCFGHEYVIETIIVGGESIRHVECIFRQDHHYIRIKSGTTELVAHCEI